MTNNPLKQFFLNYFYFTPSETWAGLRCILYVITTELQNNLKSV